MHIYGYGQLENVKISNLTEFQVFYGENEAGKSTIMAFIHGVLFGFPTKQQSELRYEPKHSSKYGGNIRVYHEELGYAVIERVKGKATGDVKVILDNGTIGGEELLKQLVANFDKGLFQAVFSFNLHGLQNIHQMKSEDIGKFLFSAGTLGTGQLSKAETLLHKELESRFRPSGKRPVLNEKLQKLHEVNGDLKKAAAKNNEIEKLIEKKELLQQEMAAINGMLQEVGAKVEELNEWKRIETIVKEEKWTKEALNEIGQIVFPTRGIERMEQLNQLIHPVRAEIMSMTERTDQLNKELTAIQPDLSYLENESDILTLLDQLPRLEQLKQERQQCETKLVEYEDKLSITREKLHLPIDEEDIFTINTNIYMKNQVEVIARKKQKLEEVKEELEERYQENKILLEEVEKDARLAESMVLPKQKRVLLEEQVSQGNDKKTLEWEVKALHDKIDFYQQAHEREKVTSESLKKQRMLQFSLLEIILIGLPMYGFLTKQWVLLLLGILGVIIVATFMTKNSKSFKSGDIHQIIKNLNDKEKQLKQRLHSAEYINMSELENQLLLDNQRREELQLVRLKLKQQQSQYEKVIVKFEEWEAAAAQNNQRLFSVANELMIPEYIATSFLQEAFELIEQYKSICREKKQIVVRLEQINLLQKEIVEGLKSFESRYFNQKDLEPSNIAYLLRNKLKDEHEKKIKSQERLGKLADLNTDLKQKSQQLELLEAERKKLIQAAMVETDEQFYELGAIAEKQEKLLERYHYLASQLQYSLLPAQQRETFLSIQNSAELIDEYDVEAQRLRGKLKMLQEEFATINYEIQVLEEGGVYSEILHHFKQKKYELEEAAKEWSVYCLAQEILSHTIDKYKKVHLPRMLSKAEEYLSFLTSGIYRKIHLQSSGSGFLIEREDHTLFEANELSQATTEQVYVAIRLALATTLYEKYTFPIIIDDSFVNFDAKRTEKVMELLNQLKGNQILFFTCHQHLLPMFHPENILYLEKGAVQISS